MGHSDATDGADHAAKRQIVVWDGAPKLAHPLLLVAFEGWFDAGECATGALSWIRDRSEARRVCHIDPEEFFDFQESRPHIEITSTGERHIRWPEIECHVVPAAPPHDLVLLSGIEPRMRWRTFCTGVVEIASELGCEMVVTLGAMVAGVAHSRTASVKGSAANAELAARLGLDRPTYQGPTGIIGTLHDVLDQASLPVVSLRVGVPHYVAGPPNPKGTRALLAHVETVTGVKTGYSELDSSVQAWEQRVNEAVARDPEIVSYIQQLEAEADRTAEENLPSGDDLAQEFQRFLAEQRQSGPSDGDSDSDKAD
ncbi:PAC2 family protein [Candidatus Poriferisodalis sp.]|uniref:PAC2 family protein n=1 Tax=Candidatus Poriferisodalis sp. TaxID=3101277 RepID=UPI003AF73304